MKQTLDRVKAWLGPVWWYGLILFAVQRFGDVISLYAGLWLIPKWVAPAELGALLPLTQLGGLFGLPLGIVLTPFTKYINVFASRGEDGKVKALLTDAFLLTAVSALAISAYTWLSAPHVFARMRIREAGLVWLLCLLAVMTTFMPVLNSAMQALKRFRSMTAIGLSAAPARLLVLLLLLPLSGLFGYFSAQAALYAVSIGIGLWGLREVFSGRVRRESYSGHLREMCLYTAPVAAMMVVSTLSSTVQVFVIRQRLPDVESAAFYFTSRFAELPNMLWSAAAVAYFPLVSESFEKGHSTSRILAQTLAVTVAGGGAVAAALGVGIGWLFGAVEPWRAYQPYAYLVVWMAMSNVFRVAFACFSTHEMACRRFGFLWYSVPLALLEAGLLVALTGYGYFTPYLPEAAITWMASLRAARLEFITALLLVTSGLQFLGLLIQATRRNLREHAVAAAGG